MEYGEILCVSVFCVAAGWPKFHNFSAFSSQRFINLPAVVVQPLSSSLLFLAAEIVLNRWHSRAQGEQGALALLFSREQSHPAAHPWRMLLLGERGAEIYRGLIHGLGWAGLVAASRGSRPTSCATSSHHSVSHNSRAASVPPTLQNEVLPLWCCSTRKQRQQSTHSSQNSCVTSVFLRFPFLFVLNARKQVCYLVV